MDEETAKQTATESNLSKHSSSSTENRCFWQIKVKFSSVCGCVWVFIFHSFGIQHQCSESAALFELSSFCHCHTQTECENETRVMACEAHPTKNWRLATREKYVVLVDFHSCFHAQQSLCRSKRKRKVNICLCFFYSSSFPKWSKRNETKHKSGHFVFGFCLVNLRSFTCNEPPWRLQRSNKTQK